MGLVFSSLMTAAAEANKPVVAVFQIQNKAKLNKDAIEQLTDVIATELSASQRYQVIPSSDLKTALAAKKSESYEACYDESCQIEIGKELAAEKTLATKVSRLGKTCIVTMQLFDLRKSASENAAKTKGKCDVESILALIEQAVRQLTGVRRYVTTQGDENLGDAPEEWNPTAQSGADVIVEFSSQPSGAVVMLDGRLLCQATPCSKSLSAGAHEVSMQKERYLSQRKSLALKDGQKVSWSLSPNFAVLNVDSAPSGLTVQLDGKSIGTTPITKHELSPGRYQVVIDDQCFHKKGQAFSITANKNKIVNLKMEPRQGAIKVSAEDKKGNALKADVHVDGEKVGRTPGTFKVSVCAKKVELKQKTKKVWKEKLSVKERQVTNLKAVLGKGGTVNVSDRLSELEELKKETELMKNSKNWCLSTLASERMAIANVLTSRGVSEISQSVLELGDYQYTSETKMQFSGGIKALLKKCCSDNPQNCFPSPKCVDHYVKNGPKAIGCGFFDSKVCDWFQEQAEIGITNYKKLLAD